jgi:predicted secreted acid phosphatase
MPIMSRHLSITAVLFVGTLLAPSIACMSARPAASRDPRQPERSQSVPAGASAVPNLYDAQQQVDAYIRSGRYDADVARVASAATAWLEEDVKKATKPAIVLDIDETSLSNWPAYRLNGWGRVVAGACDLEQGPCGLRAWQALGQSKALAPVRSLTRRAHELGVAVFFISARPANLRAATERNLREQGYQWEGIVVLPEGASFASAVDFKAPERRKLAAQGYTILLSIGDQNSDLAGGYADRTFKLPNPVYMLP